jgi:23S rRNA (adenine2503-C2)-methyltransferase
MNIAQSLHDLSYEELEQFMKVDGIKAVHAHSLWRLLHWDASLLERESCQHLLGPLRHWIDEYVGEDKTFFLDHPEQVADIRSSDGMTRKFLLKLRDGQTIETVLMSYDGRFTACVSTQVGCAMGCVFCATGQMGFTRHLRPGEIIAQVLHVQRVLRRDCGKRLRNLVLMGMGEPLHNYDAVMRAMTVMSDVRGPSLSAQRITISTVGVAPAIRRMAEEKIPYNLALSLHGANQAQRSALIPVGKKWQMEELMEACRIYNREVGKGIFIEWTLIAGTNDSPEIAAELAELLRGIDVHINLIPLNPTEGYAGTATATQAGLQFQKLLRNAGYPVTFRQRRGIDVAAGCGQLKSERNKRAESFDEKLQPTKAGPKQTQLDQVS